MFVLLYLTQIITIHSISYFIWIQILMTSQRKLKLFVEDQKIWVEHIDWQDYFSLTDMVEDTQQIWKWLSTKNTLEYLWWREMLYNTQNFNHSEFGVIKNSAWSNSFYMSAWQRKKRTWATWIYVKRWKTWWTYAHIDIALEFATWLSPTFKLLVLKDYQRLKDEEQKRIEWWYDFKRKLAKVNYWFMTDAVKKIIPEDLTWKQVWFIYAEEADIVNLAIFNKTASEWKTENPELYKEKLNMRDLASPDQLLVLANLQMKNAELIEEWIWKEERLLILNKIAIDQLTKLSEWRDSIKKLPPWKAPNYLN